jgi:hypothetical protein
MNAADHIDDEPLTYKSSAPALLVADRRSHADLLDRLSHASTVTFPWARRRFGDRGRGHHGRMPQRWKVAGWICIAISAVFVIAALFQVFRGDHEAIPVTLPVIGDGARFSPSAMVEPELLGFVRAVVFGALAGVAFFVGLACFFWSAVVEARHQRAEIVTLLQQQNQGG